MSMSNQVTGDRSESEERTNGGARGERRGPMGEHEERGDDQWGSTRREERTNGGA